MHSIITCKVNEVPCMTELKKGLEENIYFVGFVPETNDMNFKFLINGGDCDSLTLTTSPDQARDPLSENVAYITEDRPDDYGSLGIFVFEGDQSKAVCRRELSCVVSKQKR